MEVNLSLIHEEGGVPVVGDPLADQRSDEIGVFAFGNLLVLEHLAEQVFREFEEQARVELLLDHARASPLDLQDTAPARTNTTAPP